MHTVIVSASPRVHLLCLENAFSLQVFTTYGSYNSLPLKQGTPNFDGRAYEKGTLCSLSLSLYYSNSGPVCYLPSTSEEASLMRDEWPMV